MAKTAAKIFVSVCPVCEIEFQSLSFRKYCTPRCTKIAGRTKSKNKQNKLSVLLKCKKCDSPFAAAREDATLCYSCVRLNPKESKNTKVSIKVIKTKKEIACTKCKHWVETPGAEMGFSCARSLFRHCKPYLPGAVPFERVN